MIECPDITNVDVNEFTPAMRQFVEVKQRYPDTLVFFRMGDFYETFFDDAVKINRLIGITLTKRGKLKSIPFRWLASLWSHSISMLNAWCA